MAFTFDIIYTDDNDIIQTVNYLALDSANGRKALTVRPDIEIHDDKRFHVPGVNGNYIVRGGKTGGNITVTMRYIGDLAGGATDAMELFKSDQTAYASRSLQISTYTFLNVLTFQMITDLKATGRVTGQVWFDAQLVATRD